ncbi:MAG: hypothetical protein GY832_13170 [Chloroflexi bacterium]|nr:hypothetical protein [Chloroflexota bacterium]
MSVWIDDKRPRLLAAVPCEDAATSASMGDGRVSLQRVFYDLYAGAFPAAFERLNVATMWMGGEGEYTIGARLTGPDGTVLAEAQIPHTCQPEPTTMIHLIHFSSDGVMTMVLPQPGRYDVDVLLDDIQVSTFPLFVVEIRSEVEDNGEN